MKAFWKEHGKFIQAAGIIYLIMYVMLVGVLIFDPGVPAVYTLYHKLVAVGQIVALCAALTTFCYTIGEVFIKMPPWRKEE